MAMGSGGARFNTILFINSGVLDIATERKHRINGEIRAQEVRLIDVDGEQIGIKKLSEALALAEEHAIDLVEIAPQEKPPVCRYMDYGKFRYQEKKSILEYRVKQKDVQV